MDEETGEDEAEGEFADCLLFGHYIEEVQEKGARVNEHGNFEKIRIIQFEPLFSLLRLCSLSNIEKGVNEYYIKKLYCTFWGG